MAGRLRRRPAGNLRGWKVDHPAARMARLSCNVAPEMNSPIQLRRVASMCHAIASTEAGAGSGMSLRTSLPSSQPRLCE